MLKEYKLKISKGKESNQEIVKILEGIVNNYPELRFGQILLVFDFITAELVDDEIRIVDPFNEESVDTLKRVRDLINKLNERK